MSDLTFTKVSDLPIVHIQNFYSFDELEKIMNELNYLYSINRYKGAEEVGGPGTAYENGEALKVGKGLHLNVVYDDVKQSDILNINRKLFDKELVESLMYKHPFFRYIWRSNKDETKIHYFENGDHYKAHTEKYSTQFEAGARRASAHVELGMGSAQSPCRARLPGARARRSSQGRGLVLV